MAIAPFKVIQSHQFLVPVESPYATESVLVTY